MELGGIHHISAVTGNPSGNVAFYTQVLGMRLVKKTVNQDDVSMYHLFYGDEAGQPGTELTFFDWPQAGPNMRGSGTIGAIGLRVAGGAALSWWSGRLSSFGVIHEAIEDFNGRQALAFEDPEGQRLLLVDDGSTPGGMPWRGSPVPPEMAIRGLHSVTLVVDNLMPSVRLLTDVLGFRQAGEYSLPDNYARPVQVFEVGPGGPGTEVHLEERPEVPRGNVGVGGVHHVAFRTPNAEEHQQWRDTIRKSIPAMTRVIDRFYFRSFYFREPGGILFEIATDGPGFAIDEDPAHLGEQLSLPPFLESRRKAIESRLQPIEQVDARNWIKAMHMVWRPAGQ